ncbi:methyltransferase domain-containing protein [Tropicimonas sp. IMCC6043]|uniref:methyltransferase domain-containing protein n=1 Tax=Tropicimonas sp. IMCC6043 TaxID=2510645 RepID=UPI00101C8805|nr:methyltransferase domain-containing protein [Tropicimonas sp. IMCC6043]RYH10069.1 methyltransferase domain-containing protein [Tropicimonas sp. IMCC6043]
MTDSGAKTSRAHSLTEQSIEAFEERKTTRSIRLARKAAAAGPDLEDSTRLVQLLRGLGETADADELEAKTIARLEKAAADQSDDANVLGLCGHLMMELGRFDRAEDMLLRANEIDPTDGRPQVLLLHVLLKRGEPDKLLEIWEPFLNQTKDQAEHLLLLAKALGHFGYREHGEKVLLAGEALFAKDRDVFETSLANLRGETGEWSQRELATGLFDQAARRYDENLKAIGNAGPQMIGQMLAQLDFAPGADLRILDAGCGTGLCAPYLRPFAASIHGCDVSTKMLDLCKEKQLYDLLTRTDLLTRATYPPGPFDLAVCGDVLTYFGDLTEVFGNLASVLRPGGWLIFTIEDATEAAPPAGHLILSSGRHAHSLSYAADALAASGFTRPKAEFADTLRYEFREPILGRVIAAQRLAIFGPAG